MSGGTSPVINATLSGVISEVKSCKSFDKVYAGKPGIQGALSSNLIDLTDMSDEDLLKIKYTPGSSIIGTTRISRLEDADVKQLSNIYDEFSIDSHINIGGNGTTKQSIDLSSRLGSNINFVSAPKTVDNDLGSQDFHDMYFTPGFPTCVNYWAKVTNLLDLESLGACSHDKVLIAQTFGRDTGFIAAAAKLFDPTNSKPLMILLPEDKQDLNSILNAIRAHIRTHGSCIIFVSDGYPVSEFKYVYDKSGQIMFGSSDSTAAQQLVSLLLDQGIQARSCIPTVLQRQISEFNEFDIFVAEKVGIFCVSSLSQGDKNFSFGPLF